MSDNIFIEPICKICGKEFKTLDPIGLHLKKFHNMTHKEYYDKFYKKPDEGFCKTCGNPTIFRKLCEGYKQFCSSTCASRNKEWLLNREKTCIKKYGTKSYSGSDECKEKIKNTNLEKYGVEYYSRTKEFKERFCQTNYEKYGVSNYTKTQEYKDKTKATNRQKYGKDYYLQTNECDIKKRKTCLEKYGYETIAQVPEIKEKIKNTNLERYGTEYYMQTEESKEKYKRICLEKYGYENAAQSPEIKEKIKKTNLLKYGVENASQSYEVSCKLHNKFKINDKCYDSKWEYLFEKYLIKNNIEYVYHPNIYFEYYYENKLHIYYPDFLINNQELIEIKGLHFFENYNINNRMINPYNRDLDDLAEAKHQCMIKNNVKIITDIKPYLIRE